VENTSWTQIVAL